MLSIDDVHRDSYLDWSFAKRKDRKRWKKSTTRAGPHRQRAVVGRRWTNQTRETLNIYENLWRSRVELEFCRNHTQMERLDALRVIGNEGWIEYETYYQRPKSCWKGSGIPL